MRRGIASAVIPIQPFAPIEKSEWERLLVKLGLSDDNEALEEMRAGGVSGAILRAWVRDMAYRRFIPLKVLEFSGLTVNVDFRFPIE